MGVKVGLFSSRAVTWETVLLEGCVGGRRWGVGEEEGGGYFIGYNGTRDISALIVRQLFMFHAVTLVSSSEKTPVAK